MPDRLLTEVIYLSLVANPFDLAFLGRLALNTFSIPFSDLGSGCLSSLFISSTTATALFNTLLACLLVFSIQI